MGCGARESARAEADVGGDTLPRRRRGEVRRVYAEHFEVYGVRKIWRQLRREGSGGALHGGSADAPDGAARSGAGPAASEDRAPVQACPCRESTWGERLTDRVNREFKVNRPNVL